MTLATNMEKASTMYKLISFNLCPFVQRSVIVLNEKEVPYEIADIDLRNKPDWFLTISPTGRVPVMQTPAGVNLFESAVINEYLDEMHAPRLLSSTPLARAQDRMWRDFIAALYGPIFMLYSAKSEADAANQISALGNSFSKLEAELDTRADVDGDGPYFNGHQFSIVDVVAAPLLMRLGWVERVAPTVALLKDYPRVSQWRDSLLARPSVQDSVLPDIYDIFVASLYKADSWLAPVQYATG